MMSCYVIITVCDLPKQHDSLYVNRYKRTSSLFSSIHFNRIVTYKNKSSMRNLYKIHSIDGLLTTFIYICYQNSSNCIVILK